MVALQRLLDEMVDLAGGIDLSLRCSLIEDVVEVELPVVASLGDLHLPPGFVPADATVCIA